MTSDLCVGERPFKCESCNYLAANQHEVTRHARQVHNGPKPLACPYCEYKTADRSNFKKHVELHLNPRQFLCPLCKYAASKKCNLQYHIKSRHAGCNVSLDVSKVKLRVKKADGAEETSGRKLEASSSTGEDAENGEELQGAINLSVKSSNAHRKSNTVPEKVSKEDRKGSKKTDRKSEPRSAEPKSRRRVKKTAAADEPESSLTPAEESAESTESLNKTRRSGPKKAELLEAPQAGKRRAAEALDLSTKCPSETPVKVRRLKAGAGEKEETTPLSVKKTRKSNRKSTGPEPDSSAPPAAAGPHHEPPSQAAPLHAKTPRPAPDQPTEALGEDTPIPTEDSPPPPPPHGCSEKEADAEDDEGIHSSHEGGSDISDSASEGSEDSGLNGNGAASGKMANDPETPTDEIPTPVELKSHMCIFCDRTFPLEAEYRRHLNRHLVNVYYMDAGPGY